MRTRTFTTVNWEKYLVPTNPYVKNFLDKNGDDVLWQIAQNIDNATRLKKENLAFVVHVNAASVVVIDKKDYEKVLDYCNDWFIKKEYYEKCAHIQKFKKNVSDSFGKKRKITNKKEKNFI